MPVFVDEAFLSFLLLGTAAGPADAGAATGPTSIGLVIILATRESAYLQPTAARSISAKLSL